MSSKGKEKEVQEDSKQKVVEEELEDSDSDDGTVKVTRVGYIKIKMEKKKNFKTAYCVLIGGTFYHYVNTSDVQPQGKVELSEISIIQPAKGIQKEFSFSINKGEEVVLACTCSSEQEMNHWTKLLKEGVSKEPADPPAVAAVKSKKAGIVSRAKKRAASKTATSVIGKKVMKAIVNEETTTLLNALKRIVKHESTSTKKADELEKNIIKIAVKSFLLIENKVLSADDFLVADKPLRDAFELMVKVFNGRGRVKDEKITEALKRVEDFLKKAEEVITNLLGPHLTANNMIKIPAAFGCIANEKFLNTVFRSEDLESDLDKLIDAMEYYTQFHYH